MMFATYGPTWESERRYWAMLEPLFRETMQAIPLQGSEAIVDWFDWLRRSWPGMSSMR